VGDWVWLFSETGIQQNATPYRITAIEQGSDGHWYAQFRETTTGWRLDQCEKAESLTAGEAFDALYEGMLGAPLLPTSRRESRFSMAYSHPYS